MDESLPEQRRPPAFATARGLRNRFLAFWQTTGEALNLTHFARNTTVWEHHRPARSYVLCMAMVVGLIALGGAILLAIMADLIEADNLWDLTEAMWADFPAPAWFLSEYSDEVMFLSGALALAIGVGLVVIAWTMVSGVFVSWFGFRDIADRVVVLCYATAWLPIPVLLAIAGAVIIAIFTQQPGELPQVYIPGFGDVDGLALLALLSELPAFVTFLVSFTRLRRALREVRWANA